MSSIKRKAPEAILQRRVRARRDSSEEIAEAAPAPSESEDNAEEEGSEDSNSSEDEDDTVCIRASNTDSLANKQNSRIRPSLKHLISQHQYPLVH